MVKTISQRINLLQSKLFHQGVLDILKAFLPFDVVQQYFFKINKVDF